MVGQTLKYPHTLTGGMRFNTSAASTRRSSTSDAVHFSTIAHPTCFAFAVKFLAELSDHLALGPRQAIIVRLHDENAFAVPAFAFDAFRVWAFAAKTARSPTHAAHDAPPFFKAQSSNASASASLSSAGSKPFA